MVSKKSLPIVTVKLDRIVGGGQAIATLENGQKLFVWGGLPGEIVRVQITKKKSKLAEGFVTEILSPSRSTGSRSTDSDRVEPRDPDSYLSTSPWQIMSFGAEQRSKQDLIKEAFELHHLKLPNKVGVYSDDKQYEYRNKVEFSWYWNFETDTLDLAFYRRGSHGKIPVEGTSLANPAINHAAKNFRNLLREKCARGSDLKTLLVRCNSKGEVAMQLYVKESEFELFSDDEIANLKVTGFELIYSNPQSPASIISKRLQSWGQNYLTDSVLGTTFTYAVEGFFQINLPVYEQALTDMKQWIIPEKPTVDLYSGVGTIGLTIGGQNLTMIESNPSAFDEMRRNVESLGRAETVNAVLTTSENALEYITADSTIIFDPPRAGLHDDVIGKILKEKPNRIIYLSCNPVTQARDVAKLGEQYKIIYHQGYNFFPRTPHIEHLIVLEPRG